MEFSLLFIVALHCALFGAGLAIRYNRDAFLWGAVCLFTGTVGIAILWAAGQRSREHFDVMFPTPLKRWQTLLSVDDELIAASNYVRAQGGWHAERELAERYLYLNDKQYLDRLVADVIRKYPPKRNKGNAPVIYAAGE